MLICFSCAKKGDEYLYMKKQVVSSKNIYVKNGFNFDTKNKEIENKMIADLINDSITTDNIVEFNDTYSDDSIISSSIAKEFAIDNKSATIITPKSNNVTLGNLNILKTKKNNPYGNYQEIITPNTIKLIKDAKCFVVTSNLPRLERHFKAWAGMNATCIYAISGQLDKALKEKDDEVRESMKSMTGNYIDLDCKFSYDKETNIVAKVYILKR